MTNPTTDLNQPAPTVSKSLQTFDKLPDSALVRGDVVRTLIGGVSRTTLHRRVVDGTLPAPQKFGGLCTWRVGDLRSVLGKQP
jgi:predicted DNA-binding transcriptional regulator AlpA